MNPLKRLIKGEIGRNIISLGTVDSTNVFAMDLGEKGALHGTVVVADCQTKGRGRMGRTWVSPAGVNIYMSIVLRPPFKAQDSLLLTVLAAVACCKALRDSGGGGVSIKWPNDLVSGGRKLGGILTETKFMAGKILFAVLGVGINVNSGPADFPPDLRPIATSLMIETSRTYSRTALTGAIINEIDYWYDTLVKKGREPLLREWRVLASTLGKSVIVKAEGEAFTGIAEDIDDEGMLLLRMPSDTIKRISSGDLTVLR